MQRAGATLLLASLMLVSAGCSAVRYQPADSDADGVGYSEVWESPRTWKVFFCGTESYSDQVVRDFLHLRAAEMAVREGARYFVVRMEYDYSRRVFLGNRNRVTFPLSSGIGGGTPRGPASVPTAKQPDLVPSAQRMPSARMSAWVPKRALQIELVAEMPRDARPVQVFEARPVMAELRAKYGLQ